jgi:hypothetical protein
MLCGSLLFGTADAVGCYNTGQWGLERHARCAIRQFLDDHAGFFVCPAFEVSDSYGKCKATRTSNEYKFVGNNGVRYHWNIEFQKLGKHCALITGSYMNSAYRQMSKKCRGDNSDTQGGIFEVGDNVRVVIDPNAD